MLLSHTMLTITVYFYLILKHLLCIRQCQLHGKTTHAWRSILHWIEVFATLIYLTGLQIYQEFAKCESNFP